MSTLVHPTMAAAIRAASRTAVAPLAWSPTNHLLSRCTFGPTAASRRYVNHNGADAWYAGQVAFANRHLGYGAQRSVAAQGPLLQLSPYDLRIALRNNGNEYAWDAMDQLGRVTLGLQAWSGAQLYEVLVDFFSNHLNVPNRNDTVWITRHTHDRDVVRRYAMGSFTSMLLASAKNPAMLTYLNLADSTKGAVNENYGRELLELHTVGLNYSESDVQNTARLLTGRTLDQYMHYVYDDYIHATGPIKVLDFTHANSTAAGGERAGDDLLRYLAGHRFTAQHLAQKLCVRLVSDQPPAELVSAVAKAYLDNHTEILPMVSTILRSTAFWESRGAKVRRPAENVHATIRTLGVGVKSWPDALNTLTWVTGGLGNRPLEWSAPNGYPDVAAAWRSSGTLLDVWNAHLALTGGWWSGMSAVAPESLYGPEHPATSGQAINFMTRHLTGMTFSTEHRRVLQHFLDEPASTPMSNSTLRWLAVPLAAVILDGPHHALR